MTSDNFYDIPRKRVPRLSVLMPLYNGERFLPEALESVLSQTFTDFELLIVDDGSSDGSASIVRSFSARDSRIRGFFLKKNVGIAAAMNMGLREARAPLIARMDCDDYCAPSRFAKQVSYMDEHADIYILGCRAVNIDVDNNMIEEVGIYKLPFIMGCRQIVEDISKGYYSLLHPTLIYRTAVVLGLGGYREVLPIREDDDLYERIFVRYGAVFANLPDVLYSYRRHQGSITSTNNGRYNLKELNWTQALIRYSSECFKRGWVDPLAVVKDLSSPPLASLKDEFIIMELVFYQYVYRFLFYQSISRRRDLCVPSKNLRRFKMIMGKLSRLPKSSKIREFLYRRFFLLLLPAMPKDKDERVDFLKSFDDALLNSNGFLRNRNYSNLCLVVARGCFVFGEWKYFMRYMFISFRVDFIFTLYFIFLRTLAYLRKCYV